MITQISGVILDLDGLLIDTERLQLETGPSVLESLGHALDPGFFYKLVGVDRVESARLISLEVGVRIDNAVLDKAWDAAMDNLMQNGIPLRPGVHAFLDALDERRLPRAIATNSMTARAEWKLRHAGLIDRIDAVVGVDMVRKGKPEPDVYIEAARCLGLPPADCAALDDSDLGVRAAVAAGVKTVIHVPDIVQSHGSWAHHQAASLDMAREILGL